MLCHNWATEKLWGTDQNFLYTSLRSGKLAATSPENQEAGLYSVQESSVDRLQWQLPQERSLKEPEFFFMEQDKRVILELVGKISYHPDGCIKCDKFN